MELGSNNEDNAVLNICDYDYLHQIQDEICLEGLDGITLQGLWIRLSERPRYSHGLTQQAKDFVWECILGLEEISFYKLHQSRGDLVLYDRYQHMDGDLGIVIEPDNLPEDIYPYCLIEDGDVKGSCSTYKSRKLISKKMSLKEAEKMAGKLVLVGSQTARTEALIGEDWDPLQAEGLTGTQWAILERVGRARYHGEVTQGKLSLQAMHVDPKTLFYHRKALIKNGLIMKQVHHQKSRGQNFQGTLFHLPRFYVERKPKALVLVRNAILYLKEQENGIASYDEVRAHLNLGNSVKKLFKTTDFQRFMKGDVRLPYREMFPDAPESEWKRKGSSEEKSIRVVKLLNLNVEADSVFKDDDETNKSQDDYAESQSGSTPGVLDQSGWLLDRSMMWQAYAKVEEAGPEGLSQQELGQRLGQGKLEARTICRNLQRRNLVVTIMKDIGRQRVTNFVAKKFETVSEGAVQYQVEKERNDQLTGNVSIETDPELLLKIELSEHGNDNNVENEDEAISSRASSPRKFLSPMKKDRIANSPMSRSLTSSPTKSLDGSHCSILEHNEGANMEISITSGYVLPDSPRKMKKLKRPDRKEEIKGETYRQLRRRNIIMEAVRQHGVIDDPTKLYKMIQESEIKEGQSAKMDKKSLMRLISKLGKEGQIHNIRCVFKNGDRKKVLHFVCEPGIDESNTVIQSAIEQAKMKFNINSKSSDSCPTSEEFMTESVSESLAEMSELEETAVSESGPGSSVSNQRLGRKYGLQPKFVKMRELHLLMFYLIYGYNGEADLDQAETVEQMKTAGIVDEAVVEEMSRMTLYTSQVSWKMFIPPLPAHQGWGLGWCLMCDVLLRLPLSVFVKLINITIEVPGLHDYLSHPVRRNYLIRTLPHNIRNKLLSQRKYIFAVHEVATRLAYIGVLQFGPQKLKEKDQVFLYLNRRASVVDTTSSSPGYHQVEAEGNYPLEMYTLSTLSDVEQFWHRLWEVCIFTPLGGSSAVCGQEITLEVMERKPAMIAALSPKNSEEAPYHDDGSVPGDGLGAAGLDSSIFAHLKRNWTWNNSANYRKGDKLASPPFLMSEMTETERRVSVNTAQGKTLVSVTKQPNVKKTTKGQKRKRTNSENAAATTGSKPGTKAAPEQGKEPSIKFKSRRPSVFTRVVGRKRTSAERKPYYDEKDKAALRLMRKLRVDWSSGEDSFLLLCKVAGSYLCRNARYQMVPYTSVRDLLHEHFPESQNKTSRACQRRLNYMLKNQSTADNVALFLEDVKQDADIVSKFNIPEVGTISKTNNEARLERDFKPLVEILMQKYKDDAKKAANKPFLPTTMAEVMKDYVLIFPENSNSKKWRFHEPNNITDIQAGVVNALITSSLCSTNDKRSWAYQLFKIYQQYPDSLLRGVMSRLRTNKMVSLKKHYNKSKLKEGNYLPLSSAPYQLSVTFSHIFLCRYQYDIYSQSWQLARKLLQSSLGSEEEYTEIVCNQEGGYAATVLGLMSSNRLQFRTEVPEQLVVLDPNMAAVDENYVRILQRYKELLKNAGSMEDSDMEVMRTRSPTKQITSTTLFSKNEQEKSMSDSDFSDRGSQERELGDRANKTLNFGRQGSESQVVFQEGEGDGDSRSQTTMAKSASRIALYMMREEMKDSPLESSNPVQHSHDFFVISSCSVFSKMLKPDTEDDIVNYNGITIDKNALPGEYDACKEVLSRFSLDANGKSGRGTQHRLHNRNVVPFNVELETAKMVGVEEGWTDNDLTSLVNLCHFIDGCGVLGATKKQVKSFKLTGIKVLPVETILKFALKHYLVLEVGIVSQRFVSHKHSREWLLHSFKMTRASEEVGSLKFSGKLYQGHGPLPENKNDQVNNDESGGGGSTSVASRVRRRSGTVRKNSLDANTGGEDIIVNSKRKNPGVGVKMTREVQEACNKINWGKVEEVMVVIKPWVRVDGTLNRRVLDRLLGAMLGVIMQTPGLTVSSLMQRFTPAIQPIHCRELVMILSDLKCISIVKISTPKPPSLFSKPSMTVFSAANMLDDDSELIVEAEVDAIVKLGMFIGDKVYTTDFASQCPCHPDRRM